MSHESLPPQLVPRVRQAAHQYGLDLQGGRVRRTSSRFCLGVEHGDYNGTDLFGVGTDRFIWLAYKPNDTGRIRIHSLNFPEEGRIDFSLGGAPAPRTVRDSWARFPFGVDFVLRREGFPISRGFDAVLLGDIPGGGMSRSASLTLNLILTLLDVNRIAVEDRMSIVDLAQAVENVYIGSPCGKLDPLMIVYARAGMGTYYQPRTGRVEHIPLGPTAVAFCLVSLDTGTQRPGLEKSTYAVRRRECEELIQLAAPEFGIRDLAEVKDPVLFQRLLDRFGGSHPGHCRRLSYVFHAQQRFGTMLQAWRRGDLAQIGQVFREDGIGLRDEYEISGPELEAMCEIARRVPGVLGERMLGGGDKGASGAIVRADAVESLRDQVALDYPRQFPELAQAYAVHVCQTVDGVREFDHCL